MSSGFIKLHRSILNWEWYTDTNTFRLFVHLILNANYETKRWKGKVIQRGQLITGRKELSDETGLSVDQVRYSLDKLKRTQEITIKGNRLGSLISIVNYDSYQEIPQKITTELPLNYHQITTEFPTTKEIKEIKKEKNIITSLLEKNNSNIDPLFSETKKEEVEKFKSGDWEFDQAIQFREWLKNNIEGKQNINPKIQSWAKTFQEILLNQAGNDKSKVELVIQFIQDTEFWRAFVHTPEKIKKNYSQIYIQANKSPVASSGHLRPEEMHQGEF